MSQEKIPTGKRTFPVVSWHRWLSWSRGGLAGAVVLLSLAILLGLGCSGGETTGKIAFVSDRDGDPEIYVMDMDGSNQTQITKNGASDEQPRWSKDRKWLAYVSEESGDREINRVGLSKKEDLFDRLTNSPGADEMHRWSPDGERLAFVSNRDGQPEIYLMDANGSNFTRITRDAIKPQLSAWSPDGQWIAFVAGEAEEEVGIIARNPDGVNVRQLTRGKDYDASWSPDGGSIAFTSERDDNSEIYILRSNASIHERLTHNTTPDLQPRWSPIGDRIVFVSERDGNSEIYMMNPDGSAQVRLTHNDARDESPVWSPDGAKIAFVSYIYGTGEIIIMDADGSNQKRLTNNRANDTQPNW